MERAAKPTSHVENSEAIDEHGIAQDDIVKSAHLATSGSIPNPLVRTSISIVEVHARWNSHRAAATHVVDVGE